jgi:hypothetical protein
VSVNIAVRYTHEKNDKVADKSNVRHDELAADLVREVIPVVSLGSHAVVPADVDDMEEAEK